VKEKEAAEKAARKERKKQASDAAMVVKISRVGGEGKVVL
jgi:hypothetical protein